MAEESLSQHISRKELKKDEIRETLAHGAEAVFSHQKMAGLVLGAALVVALAILGWRFYAEQQTGKASAALEEAMKVFQARIRAPGEPGEPGEVTYVEEKNKYEDASKKFHEIARKYWWTRPGQVARYYAALSEIQLGHFGEAQKLLKEFEGSGDEEFVALARYQLAVVYDKTGKGEDAAKLFRQLAEKPTVFVSRPMALLALGDQLRKSNPQEATKVYNQIRQDFPDSPVAEEAEKRLETFGPKS